jgi:hypothetical protein
VDIGNEIDIITGANIDAGVSAILEKIPVVTVDVERSTVQDVD